MDDKLKTSLLALKNALKNLDKGKLNQIIDKVDSLENDSNRILVSQYFSEIEKEFTTLYSSNNYFSNTLDLCQYDEISTIENSDIDIKITRNESLSNFAFKISLNGINFTSNNFKSFNEDNALAA